MEGKAESELDPDDKLMKEIIVHGKHKNLSFFAFTATPKDKTLELFGTEYEDGSFHPFHIYSMRQAIEEGFILDVLQNYMTYDTCFKIAKTTEDNPDVPSSRAAKIIRKYQELHPYNISQKAQIIVETFLGTTCHKINGRGKMMVITSSRLAAVRYYHEVKRYIQEKKYTNVDVLVAFSGAVNDGGEEYTEPRLNVRRDGSHISESQTKAEFHDNFNVLIVAEKYQTGFDEPLLHTMIVDKKLKSVKAVQTLSRLNRTCAGKHDTFVLDFVNKKEDILEAFQPFYQETYLQQEVNADLIYQTQKELRGAGIYSDDDIEAFSKVYFSSDKQDKKAMGRMTSALLPVANRYNKKTVNERYQFRRQLRSLIKWYGYISQIIRMFDKDLHKEYVFCSYLINLLPPEPVDMVDLEGKLKLEYYKLQKTFEGAIELDEQKGVYEPAKKKGAMGLDPKEPLDEIIDKINEKFKGGVAAFKKSGADYLIAIGGGSSMDTAKAIGIIIANPEFEDVRSLEGVAPTKKPSIPIIAVPTTAGTAAEVTINYVITDVEKKRKFVCVDTHDIPVIAVVDPDMMSSMPKGLTASTGMDALTHAIEGYITKGAWEMTDMFHLKAIELISKNLRGACENTKEGREGMALGQYIAGMGFSNVGLGIVHSMAHALGAVYDTPHGVANAILLPTVMEYNAPCTGTKYKDIAVAMGVEGVENMSQEEYRKAAVDAVKKLSADVGIPADLKAIVKAEDVDFLAQSAMDDACRPGNPKDPTFEDIKNLYLSLM